MDTDLKNYKQDLLKVYEKSQDTFEKQLSFISAGALGFSMFFVEKAIENFKISNCKILIIFSWLLFGATLIINLISHHLSASNTYKTISEIDDGQYSFKKSKERITIVTYINRTTIFTLFLGLLFFIIYILNNI